MGIGDISKEKGIKKYALELISVVDTGEAVASEREPVFSFAIPVHKDHDAYERICQLEPGARISLILNGDPDEPNSMMIVTQPNIRLGPLVDSRSGEIAADIMLTRASYEGQVIYVLQHNSSCEVSFQVSRYVRTREYDPE